MKVLIAAVAVVIGVITWACLPMFENPFMPGFISTALIAAGVIVILSDIFNNK